MSRSLVFNLFVRVALLMCVVPVLGRVFPALPVPLLLLLALALSVSLALWAAAVLRKHLRPLQRAANDLIEGQQQPLATYHRDFDGLAYALASASTRVQRTLGAAEESRRELEALLDSMQDAVFAVDAAGRLQWTNQRIERLLPAGAAPALRSGQSLVSTVRDPDTLSCVQAALEEGTVTTRRTTTLVPGRIFEVNASPMPGGGAVAVLHDVTRIEEVERTQRDFVANVSHELRTPLTSITGYVETLLDHEPGISTQGREFLATILKNSNRMSRLTEDLLVMARVEAASLKLNPAPVRADTLVRDAVDAMSALIAESGAEVRMDALTSTQVFADPDAVLQVLGNLIENAIKYGAPRDGSRARVELSAQPVAEPWPAVEFRVRDHGQGIASDHLPRLFERFYRVDKTRSRESGGTGLGLSIARHIVQAQAGTIRVESELNAGATFCFTLPLALYPVADAEESVPV